MIYFVDFQNLEVVFFMDQKKNKTRQSPKLLEKSRTDRGPDQVVFRNIEKPASAKKIFLFSDYFLPSLIIYLLP